jgi:sugar phosphate permease
LIGLFGTLSYLGEALGHILHPAISDKYGRTLFTYVAATYQALTYLVIMILEKYRNLFFILPFFGMGVQIG